MTALPFPFDLRTLDAVLRQDFRTFVAKVVHTVAPGDVYVHNWHIDAMVHALMQVHQGKITRLGMTLPPRNLKSLCASVAYPAWSIGHNPSTRFACVSYAHDVAGTFSRQGRSVINSDWYQRIFPGVRLSKDTESEIVTTQGGGRFAVPVGGSFTGRGAHTIIIDDASKASDAQTENGRREVHEWYGSTLLSRLDDKQRGAIVVVMQRLHEDDLMGKLLRDGGWHHLDLPAIAEHDEEIPIGPGVVHYRRKGEALHAAREPIEVLEKIKREMGSLKFSAFYQQRPVPAEGNLVKRKWIKDYDTAPRRESRAQVIQSWDIASTVADTGDWSVCTTWLKVKRAYYLLDVWRGRLEFPDLKRKIIALAREHSPNRILIEQAGPGLHHIQELKANPVPGVPLPVGIKPELDKRERMAAQCARFEAGQVFLPKEAPWLAVFLNEILAFPNSRYDDQTDSVSQFLYWAESAHGNWEMDIPIPPRIIYG